MDIRIYRLTLDNFKGHKHLNIQFDGKNTTIYGDNATGKTSIYDALTWLLFGKDSSGAKDFEIKPLSSDGSVRDHKTITCVEAELMVGLEIIILKRTLQEVWTTRRGSAEAVYTGNTSEYFVNGVPCKLNVYDSKIKAIVPEATFKMLTAVNYFPSVMRWQDRRATLFEMANTMTDADIMATDERFAPLLEGMGGLDLADYKKKLGAEKKGFTTTRDQTPARLEECNKAVQSLMGINFEQARQNLTALEAEHQGILAQIAAVDNNTAVTQKQQEIRAKQMDLQSLEAANADHRRQQTAGNLNLAPLRRNLEDRKGDLASVRAQIVAAENALPTFDTAIEASRERWMTLYKQTFTPGTCPTCGQLLPKEQNDAAQETYNRNKQAQLDEIQRTAEAKKEAKTQQEAYIVSMKDRAATIEAEVKRLEAQIATAEADMVIPTDMEGYTEQKQALEDAIRALNVELTTIQNSTAQIRSQYNQNRFLIEGQMNQQRELIAKESLLDYNKSRIEQLQTDAQNAAKALEAIESMLYLAEEFVRFKAQFVEDSINNFFRLATFRLFREQANGGVEDRCDVVYDGVPYNGLNNGMKINVGIDIINALSRHYGVTVPLFVDNAESVTQLEPCNAQVIRLVVSESDKELRITNEN